MPDRQIKWLPDALNDMKRLRAFMEENNPAVAPKVVQALKGAAERIQAMPSMGFTVVVGEGDDPELTWFRDLYIPFGSNNYVMRYRVDKVSDNLEFIVITNIWHSREIKPPE